MGSLSSLGLLTPMLGFEEIAPNDGIVFVSLSGPLGIFRYVIVVHDFPIRGINGTN